MCPPPLQLLIPTLVSLPLFTTASAFTILFKGGGFDLNLLHVPSANTVFFLHFMGPPDPPGDFLPTHSVLRVAPPPFSSAPVGFIHDNGTDFMRQYLTPLASSQPSTTPGPLVSFGDIPHGQRFIPSPGCSLNDASPIYGLGGTSCIPEGSALRAPVPHNTTSMGPCRRPDPEEDISGSHLRHGV